MIHRPFFVTVTVCGLAVLAGTLIVQRIDAQRARLERPSAIGEELTEGSASREWPVSTSAPALSVLEEFEVDDIAPAYSGSYNSPLTSKNGYSWFVYPGVAAKHYVIRVVQRAPDGTTTSAEVPLAMGDYDMENDTTHAAPSIGVDERGYLHVTGSMHLDSWSIVRSDRPYDISSWSVPAELPPGDFVTYSYFINDPRNGRLYLCYRAAFNGNTVWRNGGRGGCLALYDSGTLSWTGLGGLSGTLTNPLYEQAFSSPRLAESRWMLPVAAEETNSVALIAHENGGIFQRYWRYPAGHAKQGKRIEPLASLDSLGFGYEGYKMRPFFGSDGDLYLAWADWHDPVHQGSVGKVRRSIGSEVLSYRTAEYVRNYTFGSSVLLVRSPDGGKTWETVAGVPVSPPFGPSKLTLDNGGRVVSYANNHEDRKVAGFGVFLFEFDGRIAVRFGTEPPGGGSRSAQVRRWNGARWELVSASLAAGLPGPKTIPFSMGPVLFGFEGRASNGRVIRYRTEPDGAWRSLDSIPRIREYAWRNGLRFDDQARARGQLRYVLGDVFDTNPTKVVSVSFDGGFLVGNRLAISHSPDEYVHRVEVADGAPLPASTRAAIGTLIDDLAPVWDSIQELRLFAGPGTLAGALVPLKGPIGITNDGFHAGDHDEVLGLTGDGASKYLATFRPPDAEPRGNECRWAYVTAVRPNTSGALFGNGLVRPGTSSLLILEKWGETQLSGSSQSSPNDVVRLGRSQPVPGLYGVVRSQPGRFSVFSPMKTLEITRQAETPGGEVGMYLFRRTTGGNSMFSSATIGAYGIGRSCDPEVLRRALDRYFSALDER